MLTSHANAVVPVVIDQYIEDAAVLHAIRTQLSAAPHVKLHHLQRFDERLAASLDGLAIAGEGGWSLLQASLEKPDPGLVFVAAATVLAERKAEHFERLLALTGAMPEMEAGLRSAFGWLDPRALQGFVVEMLRSGDVRRRALGIAATAMHRIDPGLGTSRYIDDPEPAVRARAFRTAGELGKRELLSRLTAASGDDDAACKFWGAWSAVLLGDRQRALNELAPLAMQDGVFRSKAFSLAMIAMAVPQAHELLGTGARDAAQVRWLIAGAGLIGDPAYISWLMKHMADERLGRLAGEAFSLITGADLSWLDLERKPPEDLASGPNDDPNDANVAMDEDDGLPWPDVERIERWWSQNSSRFVPGQRYFVGAPVTREHCIEVLRTGYQRQRILAAHHLCLLEPGSVLFEWRAPAWRQTQALLALA